MLMRHHNSSVSHYPLRPLYLWGALGGSISLLMILLATVVWQATELGYYKAISQKPSQQTQIHERMEAAASQASRVQVLESQVQELRTQLEFQEVSFHKQQALSDNIYDQIQQIHFTLCSQSSYQCRVSFGDKIAPSREQRLQSVAQDLRYLISNYEAPVAKVDEELVAEENYSLRRQLSEAEQSLAEYLVVMQEREREVRELTEQIQSITGIQLLSESALPPTNSSEREGKGGPLLRGELEAGLTSLEATTSSPRLQLEQGISPYQSTHNSLRQLGFEIQQQRQYWAKTPTLAPVQEHAVSSHYGSRRDPFTGDWAFHNGTDFSAPIGTPVYAPADGKVRYAGRMVGYGNLIEIEHGLGFEVKSLRSVSYLTRYGHLSKIGVRPKQEVQRGQIIGYVGNTGRSTGPHLHYEIYVDRKPINPWKNLSQFSFNP